MATYTAKRAGYDFSARSRADIAKAIESIGHERGGYNYGERYPFCFNVKLWDGWDSGAAQLQTSAAMEGNTLRPEWDSAWEAHAERHSEGMFQRVAESMWFSMVDSYSTWPGDDSGEWEFVSAGRSDGWLCLKSGPGFDFAGRYLDDIVSEVRGDDPDEAMPWDDVKRLYRALVCMAHDFRREAITAETRYQLASIRAEWESDREERIATLWRDSRDDRERALGLAIELRGAAGELPPMIESQSREARRELLQGARHKRRQAFKLLGEAELQAILTESGA